MPFEVGQIWICCSYAISISDTLDKLLNLSEPVF